MRREIVQRVSAVTHLRYYQYNFALWLPAVPQNHATHTFERKAASAPVPGSEVPVSRSFAERH